MPPVLANVVGVRKHVENVLLPVGRTLVEPEQDSTNHRQDSDDTVVPHEQRVLRERNKRLANSVGEGRHEVPVRSDEGAHVLRRLGEREFQTGDGREDLGETDEYVGHSLCPDVDRRGVVARVHLIAARTGLVDVVLDDSRRHHGEGREHEAERNALDGREADAGLAQRRVEEVVDNGDEDDERDGVEVGDDIVGDAVTGHGRGLRRQVIVHLIIR